MTRPLRMIGVLLTLAGLGVVAGERSVFAQAPGSSPGNYDAPPAHISYVEGTAVLERDGTTDDSPANMPLLAGDRVRTGAGRVEVLFADGGTLHLDTSTIVDFQSESLLRLLQGRVRLSIPGQGREIDYRIDTPTASAIILDAGDYRVGANGQGGDADLAVIRGAASLVNDRGQRELRTGERSYVRAGQAPSYPYVFNSAAWDDFDRWSEARRDARLGLSTRYLPPEVRAYSAAFDEYGTWRYDPAYGNVWYPTVAVGWRPYYYGRWRSLRPYGWTWIGVGPWAWPTHHYGRWGVSAGVWFWIPGVTWGPAWVSWAYAPGYVSWCPLGWNNHAIVNVNVHHGGYDPWHAWTVVPREHFGHGYVAPRVVRADTINAGVRGSFVQRDGGPAGAYAVPRSSSPIRVAGSSASRSQAGTVIPRPADSFATRGPGQGRTNVPGSSAIPRSTPEYVGGLAPARRERGESPARTPQRPDAPERTSQAPTSQGYAVSGDRTMSNRYPGYQPRGLGSPDERPGPPYTAYSEQQSAPRAVERSNRGYGVPPGADSRSYYAGRPSQPAAPAYERSLPPPPPSAPRSDPPPRGRGEAAPRGDAAPRGEAAPPAAGSRSPRADSSRGQGAGVQRAVPRGGGRQ